MTTYSISLDDVDLALLPLRARTHTYNDYLKKELYEFQVTRTETDEEVTPSVPYTCHICAIEVPTAFASEHAASIKHRANVRIASEASSRVRALISSHPLPSAEQSNARFCANCSTIVGKDHNKTKEHQVAVMHDKILWDLMTAYVGDDRKRDDTTSEEPDLNDGDFDSLDKEDRKEEKLSSNSVEEFGILNDKTDVRNKFEKSLELKSVTTNDTDVEVIEKLHKDVKDKNNSNTINGEIRKIYSVEKISNKINNTNDINITEKVDHANTDKDKSIEKVEYVKFVTKGNNLVKISSDNYHSFIKRESTIECLVCSSYFNYEEANSHVFTLKHLNMTPSTMIDEHCIRKINDIYSHCLLCNQVVKNANISKHHLTSNHLNKEKQAIINNDKINHVATNSKITTTVKDVKPKTADLNIWQTKYLPKIVTDGQTKSVADWQTKSVADGQAKSTAGSSAEKNSNVINLKKENTIKDNVKSATTDWPIIHPFELADQNCVRCVICYCKVPNNPENRKDHLDGSNHAKNVKNRRASLRLIH